MVHLFHGLSPFHGFGWGGGGALGFGALGLGIPALIPFLGLLGAPYLWWHSGIASCVLLKIFILKSTLLVGPPIAIGAFALGQGAGLLIGKILGIRLVLRYLFPKTTHIQFGRGAGGWKSLHHATGWQPWKLRLKLPWLGRLKYHPSYAPPLHFEYHRGPSLHKLHHGPPKTYGTFHHHDDHGHVPHHHDDPYHHGHVTHHHDDPFNHGHVTHHHDDAHHHDHEHGYKSTEWKPGPLPTYEDAHSHTYTTSHEGGRRRGSHWSDVIRRKKSPLKSKYEEILSTSSSNDIENYIADEIYKLKNGKFNLTNSEDEYQKLEALIKDEFTRDLMESIQSKDIPDFVPMPQDHEEEGQETKTNSTIQDIKNATDSESTTEKEKVQSSIDEDKIDKSESIWTRSILPAIQSLNPGNLIPDSLFSWLMEGDKEGSSFDENGENEGLKRRRKRDTNNDVNVEQVERNLKKDIRSLFGVISFLDIKQCLEKMVCDIHSRGRMFSARKLATSYEGNIITAFKIIDSLMPNEKDESISKYQEAAHLGSAHDKPGACIKNYSSCPISTNHLIRLGNLITPKHNHHS